MAVSTRLPVRSATGGSSKRRNQPQPAVSARRMVKTEAPDRGARVWEREAPEVHETRHREAPDAGYGDVVE
ncbi:MAG: hypothetical protein KatS3mg108_0449 [Isosphaeraceae bacterium]|nr:MAG: hypothetical protein KatS3mg108_0449 [Isosphaeraceae bacterium]